MFSCEKVDTSIIGISGLEFMARFKGTQAPWSLPYFCPEALKPDYNCSVRTSSLIKRKNNAPCLINQSLCLRLQGSLGDPKLLHSNAEESCKSHRSILVSQRHRLSFMQVSTKIALTPMNTYQKYHLCLHLANER
jgi:hypothetical protein